ncbi:MAG: leucine-rich repeat domain-containing protein, partial [Ruminococcus flavefaciens]|nr:leucine-rich repeat domain-containing protein [Ruminococcus flavefaciens]
RTFSNCINIEDITIPYAASKANETAPSANTVLGYYFDTAESLSGGTIKPISGQVTSSRWKYYIAASASTNVGSYTSASFNPSGWSTATQPFGVLGGSSIRWGNNQVFYATQQFTLTDDQASGSFVFQIMWHQYFQLYVNGVNVYNINNTCQHTYRTIVVDASVLRTGTNTITCRVPNASNPNSLSLFAILVTCEYIPADHVDGYQIAKQYYNASTAAVTYVPESLRKVTVLGGNIFYGAFSGLQMITEVVLGDDVLSIGERAFRDDKNLAKITIGNKVASIGTYAFAESGVERVNMPASVKTMGSYAFYNCDQLTDLTIGSGLDTIADYAFMGCSKLKAITLHEGIRAIGNYSFAESMLIFGEAIEEDPEQTGVNVNDGNGILRTVGIPSTITTIGNYAFYGSGITKMVIPDTVTSIGNNIFVNCVALKDVSIGKGLSTIPAGTFNGCMTLQRLVIPYLGTTASAATPSANTLFGVIFGTTVFADAQLVNQYYSNAGSANYYIPTSLKYVEVTQGQIFFGSFYNCTMIEEFNLCKDINRIGKYAFRNCASMKKMSLHAPVLTFENAAFHSCNAVEEVWIDTLTTLTASTFSANTSSPFNSGKASLYLEGELTQNMVIPEGYTDINAFAFLNVMSLTSVSFPSTIRTIGSNAFDGCSNIGEVYVTDIANWSTVTFANSKANPMANKDAGHLYEYNPVDQTSTVVSELELSHDIDAVSKYAFFNCQTLTEVIVPANIRSIGDEAFNQCASLLTVYDLTTGNTALTIAAGETRNGYIAFYAKVIRQSLDDKTGYTEFNGYVFYRDPIEQTWFLMRYKGDSLTLTLPATAPDENGSRYEINQSAFANMPIVSVEIPAGSARRINDMAFSGCNALTTVVIREGIETIGENVFSGCSNLKNLTLPFVGNSVEAQTTSGASASASTLFGYLFGTDRFDKATRTTQYYGSNKSVDYYIPDSLTNVTITNANKIFYGTFYDCLNIDTIYLGDTVKTVEARAFWNCTGLKSVVTEDLNSWYNIDFATETSNPLMYAGSLSDDTIGLIMSLEIPETVTKIKPYTFYNCLSLSTVIVPANVKSIGTQAFFNCENLRRVYDLTGDNGLHIKARDEGNGYIAYYCSVVYDDLNAGDDEVHEPETTADGFVFLLEGGVYYLIDYVGNATDITLPAAHPLGGAYKIAGRAFEDWTNENGDPLTSVVIPDKVTEIGLRAFAGCTSLADISIGSGVTYIDDQAFAGCPIKQLYLTDCKYGAGVFSNLPNGALLIAPNVTAYNKLTTG